MKITQPSMQYRDSFIDGLKEYQSEGGFPTVDAEERRTNFLEYIARLNKEFLKGIGDKEKIQMEHLWLVDDGIYIGTALLRHQLSKESISSGGHISYEIRPTKRGRGYGTEILRLTLRYAKDRGLQKVLVTCDEDNVASKKIIEANGGVMDTPFFKDDMRVPKLRYWIDLAKK